MLSSSTRFATRPSCPSDRRAPRGALLLAALLLIPALAAPTRAAALRTGFGTYSLFQAGVSIGTEEFGIVPGTSDTLWIRSEIVSQAPGDTLGLVNGTYVKTKPELAIDRKTMLPLRYHYLGLVRGQLEELDVQLAKGRLTAHGQSTDLTSSEHPTPIDLVIPFTGGVIIDKPVIAQYHALLALYDPAVGGTQSFIGFLPSYGQLQPITVADRGPVALRTASGLAATRFFFVRVGQSAVNLWTDDSLRIVRATLPFDGMEARLKDYVGRPWPTPTAETATSSRALSIRGDGVTLAGILERPEGGGDVPAVLLVPGLGRRTREGDIQGSPIATAPYARLSRVLAQAGYAVLRYDARGVGQSTGRADSVTLDDRAADVRAAVRALAKQKGVDKRRVSVVAADAGALGAALAVGSDVAFRAAVLLGPPGDPIDSVLAARVRTSQLEPDERDAAIEQVHRLSELLAGSDLWADWGGEHLYLPAYRELASRNPSEIVARFGCPVMIVAGGQDLEVPSESSVHLADALRANGMANVQLAEYPLLDHFLMPVEPGTGVVGLADASRDLDPDVAKYLISWLNEHARRADKKRS